MNTTRRALFVIATVSVVFRNKADGGCRLFLQESLVFMGLPLDCSRHRSSTFLKGGRSLTP